MHDGKSVLEFLHQHSEAELDHIIVTQPNRNRAQITYLNSSKTIMSGMAAPHLNNL